MKLARLQLGGHLDRYVGSLFLASYATAFLLVVGLAIIMDLASNLRWFEPWDDGTRVPALTIARYYVLNTPFLYLQIAPFVTVVAGLFTTSRLVRTNEVVAALGAGVSAHRVLLPVFAGAALAAAGMFGLRETATQVIGYERDALLDVLENERWEREFQSLWLRDESGAIVRLASFRPNTGDPPRAEIRGLEVLALADRIWSEQVADAAVWVAHADGPRWLLEGGLARREAERSVVRPIEYLEGVEFSPQDALAAWRGRERPMELSFGEVMALLARDPDNQQLQTLLQYHLTFPLANVVLLLVALPFVLSYRRAKGVEGLSMGVLFCVFYFSVDFVARSLGMEGQIGPLVASWFPVLFFGSLGAVLYEGMAS